MPDERPIPPQWQSFATIAQIIAAYKRRVAKDVEPKWIKDEV